MREIIQLEIPVIVKGSESDYYDFRDGIDKLYSEDIDLTEIIKSRMEEKEEYKITITIEKR